MKIVSVAVAIAGLGGSVSVARAEVRLASVFGDHMVLQRGVEIPVWGWATPGESVSVTLGEAVREAKAGESGRWEVSFPALNASAPIAMAVVGTGVEDKNPAASTVPTDIGHKDTVHSDRSYSAPHPHYLLVKDILVGEVWLGSGQSNMDMTVAAEDRYWCGVNNEQAEVSSANYPLIRMFKVKLKMTDTPQDDVAGQWMVTTPETVKKYSATGYFFARGLYEKLHVPIGFIDSSYGASTAQAWISPEALQREKDYAYLLAAYEKAKADWAPTAGTRRAAYAAAMTRWAQQAAMDLSNGKYLPKEPNLGDPEQNQHNPSVLFNGMIAPLIPFPIRGAIWYQGESNQDPASLAIYRHLMETLIADWRGRWREGDFPFVYVQLANLGRLALEPPAKSQIALLREAQLQNLSISNTAMAVTIDIGDAGNVHPKNKQELGERLVLLAAHLAYGDVAAGSGPLFDGMKIEGNVARVRFKDADGGLNAKGSSPVGFSIAGADQQFYWADAKVDGDSVLLSSPAVPAPVAVRYGWADNPPVNLYNKADHPLPASPFRTDQW